MNLIKVLYCGISISALLLTAKAQDNSQGGYCLKFDGSNDNVLIGTPTAIAQLAQGSYTIEAWIKTSYVGRQCIVGNYNYNSSPDPRTQAWVLELYDSGNLRMYVNGTASNSDAAYAVNDGKWHHVAGVRNSTTSSVYMYVDGKLIYSDVGGVPGTGFNVSNNTLIGSNPCTGGYALPFQGNIDEVRIWNTARSEAQIKANMYKELSVQANLIAYYKMNDGSGTTLTDNSSNGNNGTLTNGPLWKFSGCFGGSKQTLDFDGSNDYINIPNNASLQLTSKVSVEAWVKINSTSGGMLIAGKIIHGGSREGYGLFANATNLGGSPGKIIFIAGRSWSDWWAITSNSALQTNQWYHVCGTFDGRYLKVYINGRLDGTTDIGSTKTINDSGTNFWIGSWNAENSHYLNGNIDEVRIWNTNRSETEIQENMMKTLLGNETGLVGYYRMDQFDGTTLYDMTSNGNNGTLTNMDAATDWVPSSAFNTWTGAEDNSWTNADNWTNGAPTNGQSFGLYNSSNGNSFGFSTALNYGSIYLSSVNSLTLNQGAQMTFAGNTINKGTINVKSTASGDGSLITNTLSGSGTYKIDRYLSASKWHLVSSPITAGLSGVFQNIWLRPYNEATNAFGSYIVPTTIPMPTGQGFSVWTNNANEIRTFSGTVNNGTVTPSVQLTGAASSTTGWNLIGNPYPSAIDWNAASGWTKTNIGNTIYAWNNNQYATWNGSVGTNGGSRYIAMEQGFFVQASAAGAAISMNNSVRLHNSVSYLKNVNEEPADIIRVNVSINNNSDETVIAFNSNGSDNFNFETDAVKLPGSTSSPQMHTTKNDNSPLAISTLNAPENVVGKYVYIDYAETGTHQLLFTHTLTGNYIPRLYDNVKQTIVEPNAPYTFNASVGDASSRFQFIDPLPMSLENPQKEPSPTVWESNNILYIICPTQETIIQVSIFTLDGKLVYQGDKPTIDLNNFGKAMYLARISTNKQNFTKKITIK